MRTWGSIVVAFLVPDMEQDAASWGSSQGLFWSSAPSLTLAASESSLRPMSGLPFELLLALRYLRPKRTFVSFITLISVLGVSLGVAVLIIVISVMSGFDQQLRGEMLGVYLHV